MKIWAVMRRDLLKLSRNPLTLATLWFMPVVYLGIIGQSYERPLHDLPIALVNGDRGVHGERLVARLMALEAGPGTVTVTRFLAARGAIAATREGLYKAAVIVPPEFSRDVQIGRETHVDVFLDNVEGVSARTLRAAFEAAIESTERELVFGRDVEPRAQHMRAVELYPLRDDAASCIPGVIVMALFMGSLTSGVFNFVMDRSVGAAEAYLVAPIARWQIAGGLIASGVVSSTSAAAFALGVGLILTHTPPPERATDVLALLGVLILTATGLFAMNFAILGRARHPRLVSVFAGFLNVLLFFPSGAVRPVESFPGWLRVSAAYNPETRAVHALREVLFKGCGDAAVASDLAFLAVFSLIMLSLASSTFKRSL